MKKNIKIFNYVTFISLILIVVVQIWTSFRSVEIFDEGFYFMVMENADRYDFFSFFHIFINRLFGWMDPQIYHYRLLRIFLDLLGGVIFAVGFWHWLKKTFSLETPGLWNCQNTAFFIAFGNALPPFAFGQSISYNSLNNFFLLASLGLILYLSSLPNKSRLKKFLLITSGFLLALNFFIKFSAGIPAIFIIFIYFLVYKTKEERLIYLKNFILGILLGFLFFFIFFLNPVEIFTKFHHVMTEIVPKMGFHNNIFKSYLYYFTILSLFMLYFVPSLLLFLIYLKTKNHFSRLKLLKYSLIFVAYFLFIYILALTSYIMLNQHNVYFIVLFLMVNFVILLSGKNTITIKNLFEEKYFIFLLLLIFPFIMSFGTGSPLFWVVCKHVAPWFALIVFFNVILFNKNQYNQLRLIHPLIIIFFLFLQTWHSFLLNAYRLDTGYFLQNYKVNGIPRLENIKLAYESKVFYENLNILLKENGFEKGDYLMGWAIPGIVYVFDALSPGPVAFYNTDNHTRSFNQYVINNYKNQMNKSFFLLPANCEHTFLNYIKESAAENKHTLAGKVENPYLCGMSCNGIDKENKIMLLYKPVEK